MEAQSEHVDGRLEQMLRHIRGESLHRAVRCDEPPMAVDDKGRIGLVSAEHLFDRFPDRPELGRVQLTLGESGRVSGSQQEVIPVAKRDVELLREMKNHLGAGTGPTGLDEAQVAGGYTGLQCQLELTEAAALAPLSQ
jgi:hypothetical protein